MPKKKTVKALTKRLKVTKNKKLLHHPTGKGHLLQTKTRKLKRQMKTTLGIKRTALVDKIIKEIG